jgi:hypothetical protein
MTLNKYRFSIIVEGIPRTKSSIEDFVFDIEQFTQEAIEEIDHFTGNPKVIGVKVEEV